MKNNICIFFLLVVMVFSTGFCEVTTIPDSQDISISLGLDNESLLNHSGILRCELNVTKDNGSIISIYPAVPLVQFNLSRLNISNGDLGLLVLKASEVEKSSNDSGMITVIPIGSEWTEESDYTSLLVNILPAWNIVKKNDIGQMSTDSEQDSIFAFDVSNKLIEAKKKGDRLSFIAMAVSNSSYRVDFLSRESGQGPCLMVLPYPAEEGSYTHRPIKFNPLPQNTSKGGIAVVGNYSSAAQIDSNSSVLLSGNSVNIALIRGNATKSLIVNNTKSEQNGSHSNITQEKKLSRMEDLESDSVTRNLQLEF